MTATEAQNLDAKHEKGENHGNHLIFGKLIATLLALIVILLAVIASLLIIRHNDLPSPHLQQRQQHQEQINGKAVVESDDSTSTRVKRETHESITAVVR